MMGKYSYNNQNVIFPFSMWIHLGIEYSVLRLRVIIRTTWPKLALQPPIKYQHVCPTNISGCFRDMQCFRNLILRNINSQRGYTNLCCHSVEYHFTSNIIVHNMHPHEPSYPPGNQRMKK